MSSVKGLDGSILRMNVLRGVRRSTTLVNKRPGAIFRVLTIGARGGSPPVR
jgi:hypothetical protein